MTSIAILLSLIFSGCRIGVKGAEIRYSQAPMLDDRALPPVEERLPENPKVVDPLDGPGRYGGTLDRATTGFFEYLAETHSAESFFSFQYPKLNTGPVQPNLAESWDWSQDGRELTIHLREGLRWSDGEPFTTADIAFTFHEVWGIPESGLSLPSAFTMEGIVAELSIQDGSTFTLSYPTPNYLAEESIASVRCVAYPKHHFAPHHPNFNPEADWRSWADFLAPASGRYRVTLQAWMEADSNSAGGTSWLWERNPYYWKVDGEGRQLPYIDYTRFSLAADRQELAELHLTGQFDSDGMWLAQSHLELLEQGREDGGYSIGWWRGSVGMGLYFNMDHDDPEVREIFRNADFRRALSLLTDRRRISREEYSGLMTPTGTSFNINTPYFGEEDAARFRDFAPSEAAILLDRHFPDTDGDGIRESISGRPLSFTVDVAEDHSVYRPTLRIMEDDFRSAGVELIPNPMPYDDVLEAVSSGKWQMRVWDANGFDAPLADGAGGTDDQPLVGWKDEGEGSGPYWHRRASVDPLPGFDEFQSILRRARSLPYTERVTAMRHANELLADQVWIVYLGFYDRPYFIGKNMRNHPAEAFRIPDVASPFMYFQTWLDE